MYMQCGFASCYSTQMVWFQKIYIPTPRMVIGKSKGGSQKPNFLRKSMLQKWKFQEGWGLGGGGEVNGKIWTEEPFLGEVWIFSEATHFKKYLQLNSENCECLKYCRIVDCLVTDHNKVQDMQANLKTTN